MSKTNLDFTAPDSAIIARTRPSRWALKGLLLAGLTALGLVLLSEEPVFSAAAASAGGGGTGTSDMARMLSPLR